MREDLINKIGSASIEGHCDNLAIMLLSYFSAHPDCPDDEDANECGWTPWAIEKTDRMIEEIASLVKPKVGEP